MATAKLSDLQRKEIVAERVEGHTLQYIADKYGVSITTISRILDKEKDAEILLNNKKIEHIADIMKHMEGQRDKVCLIMDSYLEALNMPEKIERATVQQLATTLAILIDKFGATLPTTDGAGVGVVEIPAVLEDKK